MLGLDHSGGLILFQAWLNIDVLKSSSPRFLSISSWLVSQRLSRAVSAGGVTRHTSAPETDLQRLRWQGTEPHRCQTGQRACVSCQTGTHTHTAQLHTLMFWQWFTSWNIILFLLLQSRLKLAKGGGTVRMFQEDKCFRLKSDCYQMKMCPCVWCLRLWWSFRSVICWICSSPSALQSSRTGSHLQKFWAHLKPDLPPKTTDPSWFLLSNTFPFSVKLLRAFCAQFLFHWKE